jgi:triacylglycerol esterase/lipase EstA (alpha/beta hydrolase family)
VVLVLGGLLVGSTTAGAQGPELVPIVFVHGAAGSAAQYETQARRLAGNGYPARYVRAFEYDSSFATNTFAHARASSATTSTSSHGCGAARWCE